MLVKNIFFFYFPTLSLRSAGSRTPPDRAQYFPTLNWHDKTTNRRCLKATRFWSVRRPRLRWMIWVMLPCRTLKLRQQQGAATRTRGVFFFFPVDILKYWIFLDTVWDCHDLHMSLTLRWCSCMFLHLSIVIWKTAEAWDRSSGFQLLQELFQSLPRPYYWTLRGLRQFPSFEIL